MINRIGSKIAKIAIILNNEFEIVLKCLRMMEAAPTFILSKRFFISVAKKTLASCDFDLVLTEYYKKKLEF